MLERHAARAAVEPTSSLQHEGKRRHAAEGHKSERTAARHGRARTKSGGAGGGMSESEPLLRLKMSQGRVYEPTTRVDNDGLV